MTIPYTYQIQGARKIQQFGGRALLADEMGLGKAQPLDAKILTPSGWKLMGEIQEGDFVIGSNGTAVKITGVYPQREKEVFKVYFSDGSSTECCDDHLWAVDTANRRWKGYPPKILPLKTIRNSLKDSKGITKHYIPIVEPVNFKEQTEKLPIDPYLIGYVITSGKNNQVAKIFRISGLTSKKEEGKYIPEIYLRASIKDRKKLLRGLIDGWRTIKSNKLEYTLDSNHLIDNMQDLIWSLGGIARRLSKTKEGVTQYRLLPQYRLMISLPSNLQPFKLSRAFTKVENIGKKQCQCISVDAPDNLYVTDDYILTHNSLEVILYLMRNPHIRPVVVVCPASIKWNWEHEFLEHASVRTEVLEHVTPKNNIHKHPIVIVNYDILGPTKHGPGWLGVLKKQKPQAIILDECHLLGNQGTLRVKSVRNLCKEVPHVIGLSGTPITNKPSELWPILNILRPDKFPSFFVFAQNHCAPRRLPWGWQYNGATNLDKLHKSLSGIMIRRRKEDVLSQLPEKQRFIVPLNLVNRKQYDLAIKDFLGWLAQNNPTKVSGAKKAEKLVWKNYLRQLVAELKLPSVLDWINNFLHESDGKLIVFAVHRKIVQAIEEKYGKLSVVVTGSVIGKKRQQAFDQFRNIPETRLLIGNIKAAGEGWSARGISAVAFAELAWTPGAHTQAEDRIHGLGRGGTEIPSIYYLLGKGTVDETILNLIQRKSEILNDVTDGGLGENLDVFDLFIKTLTMKY